MLFLNNEKLRDKITACWVGKNIGGTLGTPFEGLKEMNDVQGFVTQPGEVLGNDDLDLQLIWLMAMDDLGPKGITSETLGEYWLSFIDPYWNEYGVGKCNMKEGFPAPLSGELNNSNWKNSNGAWIRTEVWACLYPGRPNKAVEYAFMDASVDHGYGEGTFAAIFVAAMESAAFIINDVDTLLKIGLSKIPADCRVARSVNIVIDGYKNGTDWKDVRQALVEDSNDLGWFQAPANIGFMVIGLLYGEGNFKTSMLRTLNCGDDTDCTAATLGSLLGIMHGQAGIPHDWRDYIGDNIITMSLLQGHHLYPKTCTELANVIFNLLSVTNKVPFIWKRLVNPHTDLVTIHDGEDDISELSMDDMLDGSFTRKVLSQSRYSFKKSGLMTDVWVEYDNEPRIMANGTLSGKMTFELNQDPEFPGQRHFHLRWFLPEGWRVDGEKNVFVCHKGWGNDCSQPSFTITANENVEALNRLVVEVTTPARLSPLYIPMNIMG